MDALKSPWSTYKHAVAPHRRRIYFMYLCIVVGNALSYSVPYFLKSIVDRVSGAPSGTLALSQFSWALSGIAFVLVAKEATFRFGHWLETTMVVKIYDRITSTLYAGLLSRSAEYYEDKFSGEITRRVEQVGTAVKLAVEQYPWEIGWPIVAAVMTAVTLFSAHPILSVVFLVWLTLFSIVSFPLLRWQYRASQAVADRQSELTGTFVDSFSNIPLVHAFAAEAQETAHYRSVMDRVLVTESEERRAVLYNKAQQGVSIVLLDIALILTSVMLYISGSLTVGSFVIVAATMPAFSSIVWNVGELVLRLSRSYGEASSALESLHSEIPATAQGSTLLPENNLSIHFSDVSFSYPNSNEEVIEHFSLEVYAGQKVGLVGKSGAGKSTVVKLLLRSYDPSAGTIKIGGVDITDTSQHLVRSAISFVPQDTALFHRSLLENIRYAKPGATDADVMTAAKQAHAHEFILAFPKGYDTTVGERGVKLSGGQRQRIALARAILKAAPILLLDEATSALDSESEGIIQAALTDLFAGHTVIAVAHRLSTLRAMDRIVVMDSGKIVEDGTPDALLKKESGIFRSMWEHQKSGFIQ